jgi:hypothetical protein
MFNYQRVVIALLKLLFFPSRSRVSTVASRQDAASMGAGWLPDLWVSSQRYKIGVVGFTLW